MSRRERPLRKVSELQRGDIIRNVASNVSYVVDATYGDTATAVHSVMVTNPPEWIVSYESDDAKERAK